MLEKAKIQGMAGRDIRAKIPQRKQAGLWIFDGGKD